MSPKVNRTDTWEVQVHRGQRGVARIVAPEGHARHARGQFIWRLLHWLVQRQIKHRVFVMRTRGEGWKKTLLKSYNWWPPARSTGRDAKCCCKGCASTWERIFTNTAKVSPVISLYNFKALRHPRSSSMVHSTTRPFHAKARISYHRYHTIFDRQYLHLISDDLSDLRLWSFVMVSVNT